jgi:EpsI family protein
VGTKIKLKLLVLVGVFLCTSLLVHTQNIPNAAKNVPPLKQFLGQIPGYTTIGDIKLEDDAYTMLKLDDYLFTTYANADGQATVYVGYYYTSSKAYAAHSPLVCYPSHGWQVEGSPTVQTLQVGNHRITYEKIVTSYGEQRELVLYWYQARDRANIRVYRNKIDMGYNRLFHNDAKHGFVRISVPVANANFQEATNQATKIIESFYPRLLEYAAHSPKD